jgi:DNA-binding NarL/FixJ family response regulator
VLNLNQARILLADDHELFRQGLSTLLNTQPDLEVVSQASDGFEALALAREQRPDLIVMDINMPVCNGLEAVRLIRMVPELSEVRIVILTIIEDDDKLLEAIRVGANGYLLKGVSQADFLQGLHRVLAGEAILPPKLASSLLEDYARLATSSDPGSSVDDEEELDLTFREKEVLDILAIGATDKEIADQLSISLHTVKSHVRHILSKLHAANRRQAVKRAKQKGLLSDD